MELDWNNTELVKAFELAYYNGFGFQPGYNGVLYLGNLNPTLPTDTEENILKRCNTYLSEKYGHEEDKWVFITDYLGYEFLTCKFKCYNDIPYILQEFLSNGFSFVTHTCQGARFEKGDTFNQETLELKLIESLQTQLSILTSLEAFSNDTRGALQFIGRVKRLTPLLLYNNYTTQQGRDFCKWLREHVPTDCIDDSIPTRINHLDKVAREYQVLWYGSFYSSSPPPQGSEKKEECCICMQNEADTLVSPCNHVIVCNSCSRLLKRTNDARTCVKCRRPIEWVSYSDTNEMDILD